MIRLPEEYTALHKARATGFQTWNVRSEMTAEALEERFSHTDAVLTKILRK